MIKSYLLIAFCVLFSLQAPCDTPLECYQNAIKELDSAKDEYYKIIEKLDLTKLELVEEMNKIKNETISTTQLQISNIKSELSPKIDQNSLDINKLNNQINFISDDMSTKINAVNQRISELNSSRYSVFNHLKWVYFVNKATGLCLTSNGSGNRLHVSDCMIEKNWNDIQVFRIYSSPEGWYSIHNKFNQLIDNEADRNDNGNKIQPWDRNLSTAQRWRINQNGDYFTIQKWSNPSKSIDINTSSFEVQLWDSHYMDTQLFKIKAIPY